MFILELGICITHLDLLGTPIAGDLQVRVGRM